ncbi:hypothetical protein M404DRAFT_24433 [Pisolithus tinctorius Marx 270]|uniref:Uncharacterized protein n=1 Tax=Pisolithus tinctorius Marx 270 TaxID=870435 RepID=A0A0C3KAV5_PISTI|nr:hypothetical protein M404DRAFT_24433 [Pisolithus tinctorius Marx 270]
MSNSRPIAATDNDDEGRVVIDWTKLPDDDIRYDTDDEEEVMKAKAKERKRRKAAEQAQVAREAEEKRVHEEEERRRAEEEKEAERKRKAETGKSSEAGADGNETASEVKKVVMDPGCTRCAWAQTVCEFVVDSNKKRVACVRCNQSKGKCRWPGDGKDTEAGPKAVKGKKRKVDEENTEAGPSNQKRAKTSTRPTEILDLDESEAGGSRPREAGADKYLGLEDKLERLIKATGLIANNLASLFELHETASILDESYGFGMVVSPSDSGSSELDSDKLREEADWLKNHGEDKGEEAEGEDEDMTE